MEERRREEEEDENTMPKPASKLKKEAYKHCSRSFSVLSLLIICSAIIE